MFRPSRLGQFALVSLALLGLTRVAAHAQVTIVPIFDTSITSRSDAADIISSINTALDFYRTRFTNPITTTVVFKSVNTGLASTRSNYLVDYSYRDEILPALQAKATSANDALALAHLPIMDNNPVNGNPGLTITAVNLRALGLLPAFAFGEVDAVISLNMSIINATRTNIDPNKYDLQQVLYHELNEVLGVVSALNGLHNGDPAPTGNIEIMDLFRYDENGNRSFNTTQSTKAYLSIDGTTKLARYNQSAGGDFHDFYSDGSNGASEFGKSVQDAFSSPGLTLDNSTAEMVALDVIGYTLKTTTVSGTVTLENAVNKAQLVTFEFKAIGGGMNFVRTRTLTSTGTFSFSDIPVGNYSVRLKGAKWLAKTMSVNTTTGNVTNANTTLLTGDANNDNFADIGDLILLIAHYNIVSPAAGYLDAVDFNCDGADDIADLLLLIGNYNKAGSP